jgi:hypothetical protein
MMERPIRLINVFINFRTFLGLDGSFSHVDAVRDLERTNERVQRALVRSFWRAFTFETKINARFARTYIRMQRKHACMRSSRTYGRARAARLPKIRTPEVDAMDPCEPGP